MEERVENKFSHPAARPEPIYIGSESHNSTFSTYSKVVIRRVCMYVVRTKGSRENSGILPWVICI